jgi:hypothetical protein
MDLGELVIGLSIVEDRFEFASAASYRTQFLMPLAKLPATKRSTKDVPVTPVKGKIRIIHVSEVGCDKGLNLTVIMAVSKRRQQ